MPKQIKIGLLWHSTNSGNLGVGALTLANMGLARAAIANLGLEARYLVIGMRDEGPAYVSGPDVDVFRVGMRTLLSPKGYWHQLRTLDCILDIGAGDSFCEIYSHRRFFFLWLTKALAYRRNVPLLFSPQTIGPFSSWPYKRLAGYAMRRAVAVITRDRPSFEVARTLAPSSVTCLSTDVAFALPFEDLRIDGSGQRPTRVGVNVSGMLFREAVEKSNRFGLDVDYADLMRRFIRHITGIEGAEVHIISHVNARGPNPDDDGSVADDLAKEFPSAIRVPNFTGPVEAKSYISSLDFLVAGRMHACIAAYSSGTPVVPVAYSRKFSGLFEQLDYPWIVPVTGTTTDDALIYLVDCFNRRGELKAAIQRGMSKVDELIEVYRDALDQLFRTVSSVS